MEDGRIDVDEQQQQDECSVAEPSKHDEATDGWGIIELLFLGGAIARYGTGDWNLVASELHSRAKILSMPPSFYSPEACKSRHDALNAKHASSGHRNIGNGRDREEESFPPWFEEVRNHRMIQLKREIERHDASVTLLTNRLKKKSQAANKQNIVDKAVIEKPTESCITEATVRQVDDDRHDAATVLEDGADTTTVEKEAEAGVNLTTEKVEEVKEYPLEEVDNEVTKEEEVKGDDNEVRPPVKLSVELNEVETSVDTAQEVEVEVDRDVDTVEPVEIYNTVPRQQVKADMICVRNEADEKSENSDEVAEAESEKLSGEADEALPIEDQIEEGSSPEEDKQVDLEVKHEVEEVKPPVDLAMTTGAVRSETSSEDVTLDEVTHAGEATPSADKQQEVQVNEVPDEKEACTTPVQPSTSTDKSTESKEKSDESEEEAPDKEMVMDPVKTENVRVGSPASASASESVHEQSKESQGGGGQEQSKDNSQGGLEQSKESQVDPEGVEDTSPTSRRSRRDRKKLQPLVDCLRMISVQKLSSYFKQKPDDPRYDQVVRRHIDLNMIKARLEEGAYAGTLEFLRDILLVFSNWIVVFPRDSPESQAALTLRKLAIEEMEKLEKCTQAEPGSSSAKPEKPSQTRKRETKKANVEIPAPAPTPAPVSVPAPSPAPSSSRKRDTPRPGTIPAPVIPLSMGLEVSTSDNSKTKSASFTLPSSKAGEDIEGGEPEVEGKSKPLKAYGRKKGGGNKGAAREKPLDAIVKKIGKGEEPVVVKEEKKPPSKKEKGKEKEKGKDKEKEKGGDAKSKGVKGSEGGKGQPNEGIAAPVRGARNKRSSTSAAVKETTQKQGSSKRSRRV